MCHIFQGHCDHPSNCRFDWNSKEQGLILGGFAIGYVLTQYMGAFLAERYGGKFVFGLGLLFDCMLNFILPWITGMVKKEGPRLRDPTSWLSMSTGRVHSILS